MAAENGQIEVVKYLLGIDVKNVLLKKGADVHAKDKDRNTSLDLAAVNGHANVVEYLKIEMAKALSAEGTKPGTKVIEIQESQHNLGSVNEILF